MPKKISHIGIAVESIEQALPFYRDVLGLEYEGEEVVAEQKVKVAFLAIGESRIELLEPTAPDSPVAKFLEKNGPGIHHLAYQVDGLAGTAGGPPGAGGAADRREPAAWRPPDPHCLSPSQGQRRGLDRTVRTGR